MSLIRLDTYVHVDTTCLYFHVLTLLENQSVLCRVVFGYFILFLFFWTFFCSATRSLILFVIEA